MANSRRWSRQREARLMGVLAALLLLAACGTEPPSTPAPDRLEIATQPPAPLTVSPATSVPSAASAAEVDAALQSALAFLRQQQKSDGGLLVESTDVAPDVRWIMTDNWLALRVFDEAGEDAPPGLIEAMAPYADVQHGLIEALVGMTVTLPPQTPTTVTVTTSPLVYLELRTVTSTSAAMDDYARYADLLLYAALSAHNAGDDATAHARFSAAMAMFDGTGFADVAQENDNLYATYKLALAILVGKRLGLPEDPVLLQRLLEYQDDESGGFYTLYDDTGVPANPDRNTETTAHAALALLALTQ